MDQTPPTPTPAPAERPARRPLSERLLRLLAVETAVVLAGVLVVWLARGVADNAALVLGFAILVVMIVVAFLVWPQFRELDHYKDDEVTGGDDHYWDRPRYGSRL